MARKNLLDSVMNNAADSTAKDNRTNYAMRGASKSMKVSIDALAEDAKKLTEGETIVDIDPTLVDVSFINDRLTGDDEAFQKLKATISQSVQETPVLLRPHPEFPNRYMIVFGHRRVRVAAALGRPVRAVIKSIDDLAHILAQGQENTAREDLSFIEKALFAKRLLDLGHTKDVIQSALTIDATLLSRMLSVSQKIPSEIIVAIGAAKSVGRDRWEELKKLVTVPANTRMAKDTMNSSEFSKSDSDTRFDLLLKTVSKKGKGGSKAKPNSQKRAWAASNGRIKGTIGQTAKAFNLSLTSQDAVDFGNYLSEQLDDLYRSFEEKKQEKSK